MRALLAGALPLGLTGCGPERRPTVALHRTGEALEVVVYLCPYDEIARLSVYDSDGGATWAVVPPPVPSNQPTEEVVTYPLFTTPPGWETEESTLTELLPDRRYELAPGTPTDPLLQFTVADLDGLGDRLLVATDDGATTMSRTEFEAEAADSCDR